MNRAGRTRFIVGFLAPAIVIYGLFVVWPVAQAFVFSLFRWRGVSAHRTFVGFENFARLGADSMFWKALTHNLMLLGMVGTAVIVVSLAVAHALQAETRGIRLLRGIYLIPQAISMVVVAILWRFIYNPNFGVLNGALKAIGLGGLARTWLADPRYALPAVAVVIVWHALGFYVMLLAAGLRTIPKEVTESAMLDGARSLTMLRRITLPLLRPMVRIVLIYLVIGVLNVFAVVFLMNDGRPDEKTDVVLTYLYQQGFQYSDYGLATALAVVNFGLVMALSGMVLALFRRGPEEARS